MTQLFTNNASGTLSVQAEIVDVTLTLQSSEGALYPSPTGADFFMVSIENSSGDLEICKCTSRTGDVLTVTRAQESTSAQLFVIASRVECRMTAGTHDSFLQVYGGQMQGELDMNDEQLTDPLIVGGEARNVPIRGTDGGTGNELLVPTAGGAPTIGANTIVHTGNDSAYALSATAANAGEGLTGTGTLGSAFTFDFDYASLNTMDSSDLLTDDEICIHDDSASEHKKILIQQLGTVIVAVTTTRNLAITDGNALLFGDGTDRVLTIPDSIFSVGAEIAIIAPGAGTIALVAGGSQTINSLGSNLTITAAGGGAYLALYATDTWALVGDLEA